MYDLTGTRGSFCNRSDKGKTYTISEVLETSHQGQNDAKISSQITIKKHVQRTSMDTVSLLTSKDPDVVDNGDKCLCSAEHNVKSNV